MPLPAALAARLAKRGLITKEKLEQSKEPDSKGEEEEVFAESYDDTSTLYSAGQTQSYSPSHSDDEIENVEMQITLKFKGHPGCPNKSNIFHECSKYCKLRWKEGIRVPSKAYLKKKNKILAKYPLPDGWKEVYDPGYGRHYYWDTESDSVSWLPPNHPKAIITECAAVLKEESHLAEGDKDTSSDESEDEEEPVKEKEESSKAKPVEKEKEKPHQKRNQRSNKRQQNDLDPMDPAAYSDIPRGGWSDGLQTEAKSGVDTTVTGSLFQMRPYPSPGDILRANKKKKVETEEPSGSIENSP
ncbi:polyglutamine-binding protein 1 [Diaphorina citri]|uniref:Polyglutamine-binding protein 1 n=1 Tax=Diaphorina citri TaxID=121845 RepID=A0A1S3DHU9_DIACI|nr:polyglutamine-binding protein 1 [Diaphorina citri]